MIRTDCGLVLLIGLIVGVSFVQSVLLVGLIVDFSFVQLVLLVGLIVGVSYCGQSFW